MKKIASLFFTIVSVSQLLASDIKWALPPTTLSTPSVNASDPRMAIDANGNIFAIWVENGAVYAKIKHINGNWSATHLLSSSGASSPRIVADSNGYAAAIWLENGLIKGATKSFSGNWSSATALSSTGASSPALAIDVSGNIIAVWARGNNIESSTKLYGANWQNRVIIASSAAANPSLAIGGTGSNEIAVVVWQGTENATGVVYAATKTLSGAWSAQQVISDSSNQAAYAQVAVDAQGNAAAVWFTFDVSGSIYSNVTVQSASKVASGVWDNPVALSAPGMTNPANLVTRIGFDSMGNALALWNTSFDDRDFTIQSSLKPLRGTWTTPTAIVNSNLYAYAADMAISSLGDALAVYMFYNGSFLLIQSAETNTTGFNENAWSVPLNIYGGADNAFPRVAATVTGNTIQAGAIWVSASGTHNVIQAAVGSRTVVLPPSNLSVTQQVNNLQVFSEYYNTLTWSASADPKVAGYLVFRNGLLLEQVGANVLQIVDNNRTQNGSVTYGVAAIDNQGSQSVIVPITYP